MSLRIEKSVPPAQISENKSLLDGVQRAWIDAVVFPALFASSRNNEEGKMVPQFLVFYGLEKTVCFLGPRVGARLPNSNCQSREMVDDLFHFNLG